MKRFRTRAGALLLAMLAMTLLVAACGDDDPEPILEPTPPDPAVTKEILLSNFKTVYEGMDIDYLDALLADDFQMIVTQSTQTRWGWEADHDFDRATFVEIHRNMFGGLAGTDADDNTVHPIANIEIDLLEQLVGWAEIPPEDENFGGFEGEVAPYRVTIQFHDANLTHRFLVQQQVNFYALPTSVDGETRWQLLGLRGISYYKTDVVTWDAVCALYQ